LKEKLQAFFKDDRPDWEKMSDDSMNKVLKFALFCIFAFFSYHFVIAVIDRFFG
tara:strand:- start:219 stop:380 length:162 start_codon:yes stop_codon:yes gene_type:complete